MYTLCIAVFFIMQNYKADCPKCNNDNFYCTPHNNKGFCFNCGYFAWLDKSKIKHVPLRRSKDMPAIRSLYTELAQIYHSNLQPAHRAYLIKRGLTDRSIVEYRIGYCSEDILPQYASKIAKAAGIATKENKPFLAGRIIFPYYCGGIVTELRGRSLEEHAERRYSSPYLSTYFRHADFPFNYDVSQTDTLVVTEGEIKTIISQQAGFNTIGLPGINVWKSGFTIQPYQKIVICFDNPRVKGRYELIQAIEKIALKTSRAFVAVLPLGAGEDAQQIDTYVSKYGVAAYRAVIENALSFKKWRNLVS